MNTTNAVLAERAQQNAERFNAYRTAHCGGGNQVRQRLLLGPSLPKGVVAALGHFALVCQGQNFGKAYRKKNRWVVLCSQDEGGLY